MEVGSNYKGNFALSSQFDLMRQQLKQAEDKWERVRPKDLHINSFDTSNLFAPLSGIKITAADLDKTLADVLGSKKETFQAVDLNRTLKQALEDAQRDAGFSGDVRVPTTSLPILARGRGGAFTDVRTRPSPAVREERPGGDAQPRLREAQESQAARPRPAREVPHAEAQHRRTAHDIPPLPSPPLA